MNSSILVYRKVQPRSHQPPLPLSTHSLVVLPGRLLCLLLFWYTKASSRVQAPGEHTNFCRRSLSHVRPRARDLRAPACPSARQAASGVGSVLYEQHASALGQDAAAQEPTHGSTKQGSAPACRWVVAVFVGAVAGTAQLPQQCACGRRCRSCRSFLSAARSFLSAGRSHAALLHDADDHRTHGSTRRKSAPVGGGIGGGGRLRVVGGPVPWSTNRGSRLFATREREARRRESALTDARVTSPQGLNLGAGLVPGGARQSGGGAAAERGREPTTARARRKVYRLGQFVCFFDSCSLTSNCNTDD